jgi:hypothetical protein
MMNLGAYLLFKRFSPKIKARKYRSKAELPDRQGMENIS